MQLDGFPRTPLVLRQSRAWGAEPLMGWPGVLILGFAVGLAGWWLHPLRRSSRAGLSIALIAGVVAAAAAKMAGNVSVFLRW